MAEKFRLDRFLAECGAGTRSEAKAFIKKGRVCVNGAVIRDGGAKVDSVSDVVSFDGRILSYEKYRYFMLNKPAGCVSATRDGLSSTVLDLLEGEITRDLFPVGRLDKDTEGFLLITNDGPLGHDLLSPKKHVDKTYLATVDKPLTEDAMETFRTGVDIGDEKVTLPAEIELMESGAAAASEAGTSCDFEAGTSCEACGATGAFAECTVYRVILREGRFHQVKRMFEALGSKVVYLKRVAMGNLELDPELEPGEYRKLTAEEVSLLKK